MGWILLWPEGDVMEYYRQLSSCLKTLLSKKTKQCPTFYPRQCKRITISLVFKLSHQRLVIFFFIVLLVFPRTVLQVGVEYIFCTKYRRKIERTNKMELKL